MTLSQSKRKPRIYNSYRGWKNIGEKKYYFKSKWEFKYATLLQKLKDSGYILEWVYEPQIFYFDAIKRGTRSFTPDFKITLSDGRHYWVEVKGYMDAKSQTKIKRFKKYYPKEEIHIVDSKYFSKSKLVHKHE